MTFFHFLDSWVRGSSNLTRRLRKTSYTFGGGVVICPQPAHVFSARWGNINPNCTNKKFYPYLQSSYDTMPYLKMRTKNVFIWRKTPIRVRPSVWLRPLRRSRCRFRSFRERPRVVLKGLQTHIGSSIVVIENKTRIPRCGLRRSIHKKRRWQRP